MAPGDDLKSKAPSLAVLALLFFTVLWLGLGALSFSGVGFSERAGAINLVQGVFALIALVILAARLQIAFHATCICSVLIMLSPWMFHSVVSRLERSKEDAERADPIAHALLMPPAERSGLGVSLKNYVEPPEMQKQLQAFGEQVRKWMNENAAAIARIRVKIYKSAHDPVLAPPKEGGISDAEFAKRVERCLLVERGSDWYWFRFWPDPARAEGFDLKPPPLSPEEEARVLDYARDWAYANMQAGDNFERDQFEREQSGFYLMQIFSPFFWVLLMIAAAVWVGRESFNRPLDYAQIPGWALAGFSRLVRKDGTAWWRLPAEQSWSRSARQAWRI